MLWKLLWFAIDSSVLLNEGVQFFFNDICHFLCIADCIKLNLYITAHLSMKMILVDSNLVRTILVIICLILIMVCPLEKNYFLVRTKLVYLRYVCSDLEQKQKKIKYCSQ